MKLRCPCNKCLVQVTCKESCEDFGNFMMPWHKFSEVFIQICDKIDSKLEQGSFAETTFTCFGEYIILPGMYLFLKYVLGLKINWEENTLMDDRMSHWEDRTDT